jgi:hypothetical protein
MTGSGPSDRQPLLRVGGVALVGVAAIAGMVGLVTLAFGDSPDESELAAPPPAVTAAPPTPVPPTAVPGVPGVLGAPAATPTPMASGGVPLPSFPGGASSTPVPSSPNGFGTGGAVPDRGLATGGDGGADAGVAVRAPLRVYNNSRIPGLAEQAAEDFRSDGWEVTEVGNYPYGIISTTTVYYRPGTDEVQPANALAEGWGMRAKERFEGLADASPGIIVIVTKDYQRR